MILNVGPHNREIPATISSKSRPRDRANDAVFTAAVPSAPVIGRWVASIPVIGRWVASIPVIGR